VIEVVTALVFGAVSVGVIGAALVLQERRFREAEKEWAIERGALLQRVQAPEQAVISHAVQEVPLTYPVPFDDDAEAIAAAEARDEVA
jgi:hypothetical protein